MRGVYIFHRALRLDDNLGLLRALKEMDEIMPVFIFTPEQITSANKYRSPWALKFMFDALADLDRSLRARGSRLWMFYGHQPAVVSALLKADHEIKAVYMNMDYTPYAMARQEALGKVAKSHGAALVVTEDYLLHGVHDVLNSSGHAYSVFASYYEVAAKREIPKPRACRATNFMPSAHRAPNAMSISLSDARSRADMNLPSEGWPATRAHGLKKIAEIKHHARYAVQRDTLERATTHLSPYLKFGVVSAREVYHRVVALFGKKHELIRQMHFRDFYTGLSFARPDMLAESHSFKRAFDRVHWRTNDEALRRWMRGMTGVPVVDAGMRELNATGHMHNRARLICGAYLVKHLFIDWRLGERYFATHLVDYDPSVNNASWQFVAGTGTDNSPYFRVINPTLQARKYDPECAYIKRWIPELRDVPAKDIFSWQDTCAQHKATGYPAPYKKYDHTSLVAESKRIYSRAYQ
jgi:deoxyribodipyrimidine photo-lyase